MPTHSGPRRIAQARCYSETPRETTMRRRLAIIAAALITLALPDLRRPLEPAFAVGNYRITLDLTHRPEIRAECVLLVDPLDSSRLLVLDSAGLAVDSVTIGGQAARFETQSQKLRVDL